MSPALAGGFFTAEPPGKLPAGFLSFFFFRVFLFRNLWVPEVFQVLSAGLGGVCLGGGVPIRRGTSGQNLQEL